MAAKVIAHIDMDAFFAAVEQRDNPSLRGQPVVIGADPKAGRGRGVVSTCSYEARTYGIHSAMPISAAYKLCPRAAFLPVDMRKYAQVSDQILKILYDFTPDIEPVSIDEAFLDITGSFHFYKTPFDTCLKIKQRIHSEIGLTASVGIAPIKMAAKIASDLCKPDGLLEIKRDDLLTFLWPLSIEKLWGVGDKTRKALNGLGVYTIGDLAHVSEDGLRQHLGENGRHLFALANGIDERDVHIEEEVKSVSNEHTFERDTNDKEEIYATLLFLSEKVSRRLRKEQLKGKTITLKIRLEGFHTFTRAFTFLEKTNFSDVIYKKARELFDEFYAPKMKIRLLGVRVSHFDDPYVQESLFENKGAQRLEKIHRAVDTIKDKFGEGAIHKGPVHKDPARLVKS
ncbi:MAG TPA: DNA polymerase IV [Candidatus Omnitrophota bacterium]|nr:DNA polymerase IV [Candidatus Omnitrophota bacterium]HPD84330.1 DNA polymerase IV [Candidatus Omnitrophota bacterium]HRZ03188.1 DNA polymerase IV [Candidatus Omnitrophota bacterium]